jgi:hypothetical protein
VVQRQAWKVADQLGWDTTYDAEFVAGRGSRPIPSSPRMKIWRGRSRVSSRPQLSTHSARPDRRKRKEPFRTAHATRLEGSLSSGPFRRASCASGRSVSGEAVPESEGRDQVERECSRDRRDSDPGSAPVSLAQGEPQQAGGDRAEPCADDRRGEGGQRPRPDVEHLRREDEPKGDDRGRERLDAECLSHQRGDWLLDAVGIRAAARSCLMKTVALRPPVAGGGDSMRRRSA